MILISLFFFLFILTAFAEYAEKVIPEDLLEKQDLPRIVIISVSIIGVILLLVNIALVAGCMFKKRAKRMRGLSF